MKIMMMKHILYTSLTIFFTSSIKAQQNYSGNSVMTCDTSDEDAPSESFLYSCNGLNRSCKAFLTFKAHYPYNSVPIIATLMSSNQYEVAQINNVTSFTVFQPDEQVIVPVDCSCLGQYYQANAVYQIPTENNTYFVMANNTYQGLSTCDALRSANKYSGFDLVPGLELRVPLRCACPSTGQAKEGYKYLLTYSIGWGDTLHVLSEKFNVSEEKLREANGLFDEHPTIYPFTTILIPLHSEEPFRRRSTPEVDYNLTASTRQGSSARKSKSTKVLSKAGIVTGGLSVLLVLVIAVAFIFQKKKIYVLSCRESKKDTVASPRDLIVEIASFDRALKVFEFREIKKATRNFKTRIEGSVYRGVFSGSEVLAVKRKGGYANVEVNVLHRINHFNIVKLQGVCEHDGYSYLVFEYMKNGSLKDWLSKKGAKAAQSWESWDQRIKIALDVSNGLLYLHSFTKPAYAHNNIKTSNILLDDNMRAKISNFSLARKSGTGVDPEEMMTQIVGTKGYMAPEYLDSDPMTPKVDIFAFGMVLLEIMTGKYTVVHNGAKMLISTAVASIMKGENAEAGLSQYVEPCLGENGGLEYAIQVVKLGSSCLARDPADRPNMDEVVSTLLKIQSNSKKSRHGRGGVNSIENSIEFKEVG